MICSHKRKRLIFFITFLLSILILSYLQSDDNYDDLVRVELTTVKSGSITQAHSESDPTTTDQTVNVWIANNHYLGDSYHFDTRESPCNYEGVEVKCLLSADPLVKEKADAYWFHIPTAIRSVIEQTPKNIFKVGFSMESSSYYSQIDDENYMSMFDVRMTYRQSSQVVVHYFYDHEAFHKPPRVPFSAKLDSFAYLQRNCEALNGRGNFVHELALLYPIAGYGECLHNKPFEGNKIETFSKHKFCIAIENSNGIDYVTEKLWHAFEAGCLPIYGGPPNVLDFLPVKKSVILVDPKTTDPKAVANLLIKLSANETMYNEYMAWRSLPSEKLSPGFQRLQKLFRLSATECQMCFKLKELKD